MFANFTTSALGQDGTESRKRAPHYHRFSASVNTCAVVGVLALLVSGLACGSITNARDGVAAQRSALHAFVALGDIKDYRVPKARYDLVIVSPGHPLDAALTRARTAYPGSIVLGYLNTMDLNELVPGAREALQGHEDWYLHDAAGQRVRVRIDRYKGDRARFGMNVGVVGYQDYLAGRATEILRAGYDGVHLDNIETDSSYHPDRVGTWISGMPVEITREGWVAAEHSMLMRLRSKVTSAGFGSRPLIINHIRAAEPEASRLLLESVEGANTEGWLTRDRAHDGPFGWKASVDQAAEVARSGKMLTLICKTDSVEREESLYLFASYLLATDGRHLYFFHGTAYRPEATVWHDFYDIDLGEPEGDAHLVSGLYVRKFERGIVAVNPLEVTGTLSPGDGHVDLAGTRITTVPVAPHSAVILKRTKGSNQ